MTDLTMSQFVSKDDLLAAQAARIAELESQLEAIGAGGVEPLRKGFVRLTDVLARLEQGFGANSAPVTTIKRHFEMQAAPAHPAEGVHAAVIAGAIFDFAGYLTTLPHEKALHCSEAHEASTMVEAITEWCKRRGLRTDGARVETWRAALAAAQPAAQGMEADLTDEQIDEAFNQMPDGATGFLKSWGYRQFARAVLAAQAKQGGA